MDVMILVSALDSHACDVIHRTRRKTAGPLAPSRRIAIVNGVADRVEVP